MKLRRWLVIPWLTLASTSMILAQTQPAVDNIIQADGSVKALYESQAVVTTQFWLFRENWTRVSEWQPTGNGTSTFSRMGHLNPGTLSTSTQVVNSSNGTTISMQATPTRNLISSSDHINVMFDDAFWAGSTFSDGSQSFTFSANFLQGFAKTGSGKTFQITRPDGFRLTITTAANVAWAAQDSRGYHMGFEFRLNERSGNWAANTARTYQATFKYSQGSNTVPDAPVEIAESEDWRPLPQSMSVLAGSALDWKDKFAVPAGSKGWLTVNANGKFAFPSTPSKVERFYGANLAHYACFPSKSEAPLLAENLARLGYNAVRLHHIDYILTDPTSANSTTLDPGRLDLLNFFVNELKIRGLYVSIDLHSLRKPRQNEVISGWINENEYKALLLASNSARQNFLTYATNLLNSQNPYTGLRWKDDPAIAWIALGNENTPFWLKWPRSDIKAMLDATVGGSWNLETPEGSRAAVTLAESVSVNLASQLRNIGAKALFTNMNAGYERALSIGRKNLDYVDNHFYFGHPDGFALPLTQKSTSPLRKVEEIGWFAASRMKGKPFTVTEFDGVAPNQFRAEFGLMAGAMAVVQKWDGMWRFQYADNMGRALQVQPMGLFSLAGDPLNMAVERGIVAMFLRGDITSADSPVEISNPLASANQNEIREEDVVRQSILARAMTQVNGAGNGGSGVVYDGSSTGANGAVEADLNKLSMRVKTSGTAGLIGSEGHTISAGILSAKLTKSRATIYLSSVDRKPLNLSRRMLLAHLTDVQNTGAQFTGKERGTMTSWGDLPHLVKLGTAEVTVQVKYPANMRVYRLDLTGRRLSPVPVTKQTGAIMFDVSTNDPNSGLGILYYEIVSVK